MAKDLVLNVVARKSSADLEALAREFDKLSASIDDSNKSAKQSVTFSRFLDDQIAETRKQVQALQQDFEKTGSLDTFGQLRGTQRNLTVLERYRRQLGDVGQAEHEAKQELTGLDAEVQRLSASYFNLTRDVLAPAEAEFAKLTERQQTQAETVKILQQRYRESGNALRELDLINARKDLERLNDEVEVFGEHLAGLRRDVPDRSNFSFGTFVESEIGRARVEVDRLRTDLNKGGGVNVFGDLRKAENDLDTLAKIGKDIGVAVESGVQDGSQQGVKFLGQAFGSLPPEAQAAIVAGIAGAVAVGAPAIGAALSGALLAGVGAAGIGTAIAVQLHNPAVEGAVSTLKTQLKTDLQQATGSFVPVLVDGAGAIGAAFGRITPDLRKGFEALAGPADHFFTGVGHFIDELGPGLDAGLHGAGVVIDELAADLPELGRDVRIFFEGLSAGADGGADALGQLLHAFGLFIAATGAEFDLLSKVFTALEIGADLASGNIAAATQHILELNGGFHQGTDEAKGLTTQLGLLGPAANGAAGGVGALSSSVAGFNTVTADAKLNSLEFADGIANLKQQLQQNKGAFDDNSAAGRQSEEAFLRLAAQAQQTATQIYQNTGNATQAAQAFQRMKTDLDAAAIQAGVSKTALAALNASLDEVFKVRHGSATLEINVTGSGRALVTNGDTTLLSGVGLKFRAGGGPVAAGQPYIVGEHGPELFVANQSGAIVPNDALRNIGGPSPRFKPSPAAAASQGGGGYLVVGPGGDTALAEMLHKLIDTGILQVRRSG